MAVVRVVLLRDEQHPCKVAADLDRERLNAGVLDQLLADAAGVVISPPARDLRLGEYRRDGVDVLPRCVAEKNAPAAELVYE
ncbi:MAG: hypothetical protein E6G53_08435 [Actinobacteria bacterium]|nr:MAG: hypothetical protein E6G53_08435 [Actinomycetota bacterium]